MVHDLTKFWVHWEKMQRQKTPLVYVITRFSLRRYGKKYSGLVCFQERRVERPGKQGWALVGRDGALFPIDRHPWFEDPAEALRAWRKGLEGDTLTPPEWVNAAFNGQFFCRREWEFLVRPRVAKGKEGPLLVLLEPGEDVVAEWAGRIEAKALEQMALTHDGGILPALRRRTTSRRTGKIHTFFASVEDEFRAMLKETNQEFVLDAYIPEALEVYIAERGWEAGSALCWKNIEGHFYVTEALEAIAQMPTRENKARLELMVKNRHKSALRARAKQILLAWHREKAIEGASSDRSGG